MARKTVKKARKSGKSEPGESQKAESIQPDVVTDSPKPSSKKADIRCEFCNKPMKDENTRKIHQRNCKQKAAEPPAKKEDDIQAAILQMKDTFEDQRQSMSKDFREREDHLQRELEEVKTVLRMEIDRHRKELERISKVEKDVAAEKQESAAPAAKPQPAESRPHEMQNARTSSPKAIDLIPMHIPAIPRRTFHPLDENESIPDLADDIKIKPEPKLDRAAVEEVVRELMEKSMPAAPAQADAGNLGGKMNQLAGRMDLLDGKLERGMSEMRKTLDRFSKENDAKRVERELEKISEKVNDIMEDSGYGERLSVSKIPPTILEIVYQAILDDVHLEIVRTKGAQDADKIARAALEEVRLKTSGSELFKFDGRKIVTDNLAKSIEANMISAKQIQTTYDVLMDRLLETVPQHKAKNFTGMIKIKSQEFAVDRATKLTKDLSRIDKQLDSTSHMVAAMAANISAQTLSIHEKINEINDKSLASKADREELDALKAKLDESGERFIRLADDIALLKAELEMKSSIREKEEVADADNTDIFLTPGEEPFIPPDVPEGGVFTTQPKAGEPEETETKSPDKPIEDDSRFIEPILAAISGGADSKTAIINRTGLEGDAVSRVLATLVETKKIIEKKSGKRSRYTTLELEMNKARDEPAPEKKGKKPGKKKVEEEPEPAPEEPAPEPKVAEHKPGIIVLDDSPEDAMAEPVPRKKKAKRMLEEEPEEAEPVPEVIPEPEPEPIPEPEPEQTPEPAPKSRKKSRKESEEPKQEKEPETALDEIPIIKKSLSELSEEEAHVLEAIGDGSVTLSGVQSKVGKHLKRFALLRALRVLIDSGHVGISARGRMELYHRITVEKMDIPIDEKRKKEVK